MRGSIEQADWPERRDWVRNFTQDLALRDDGGNPAGPEGNCLYFVTPAPKVYRHQD